MKIHLRRTLGTEVATYEDLCTLLAEIEACLKSRTLCTLYDDPFNPTYLSPGHFLICEPLTQLPAADITDVKCNRFPGGIPNKTIATVLATLVIRLPPESATASMLAEDIP